MKRVYKKIAEIFARPVILRYLKKDRYYTHKELNILVKKGVFHPGFFFSTKFFIRYLEQEDLAGKHILELGAGSGLISLICAKKGGNVTATDINPDAVEGIKENAASYHLSLTTFQSDLFDSIPAQVFDYILINPPYYRGKAKNVEQQAWYAGEKLEYFDRLFSTIAPYFNKDSKVLICLSEDCEISSIRTIASKNKYNLKLVYTKKVRWEENYILRLNKD